MKIDISAKPQFHFSVTRKQVELLIKASSHHYDGHCRSISQANGFLSGWEKRLQFNESDVVEVTTEFAELDTLLKVMEMVSSHGYSHEEMGMFSSMNMAFHRVLATSNMICPSWKAEVIVP